MARNASLLRPFQNGARFDLQIARHLICGEPFVCHVETPLPSTVLERKVSKVEYSNYASTLEALLSKYQDLEPRDDWNLSPTRVCLAGQIGACGQRKHLFEMECGKAMWTASNAAERPLHRLPIDLADYLPIDPC